MRSRLSLLLGAALMASALPAAADVSGDVVRIGVLNDQSGLYADNTGPGSVIAARMAVEDYGGKVLGKPVEVVFADHQNKADIGSNITRQWVDQEGVDAIADVGNSAVALAVQAITREKNRIHLNTGAASSDLTGKECSPTGFSWAYDTYALASGTGKALVKQGGDTWFFLSADYSFGQALERDTSKFVKEAGGTVLGSVRVPLNTSDFSSFLLQAQGSGAKVIGLANAGGDTINSIKQASEFGIVEAGQRLAGLLVFLPDIHSLGLKTAQGLVITTAFYWDQNDETRTWNKRFQERHGKPATYIQAGTYSAVAHYLKAIEAAGTDEAKAVSAKMKEMPVNDFMTKNAKVREDGRVVRDMYLVQVKTPAESKGPWDYYKILTTIPGDEAFRPLADGGCPFVKK
ncbi:branched-chain amino acid transport system substrate-binding protein [Constrictibacter sp. MBR-5]|jgi:branched-chain amino acid transport system substrate-binding protein|uniref:ABC transporter substrate-binding protein n=1 Tax=Constrictibacter sp. MBR-5 TaxID=3156467 RepID=UPI0033954474